MVATLRWESEDLLSIEAQGCYIVPLLEVARFSVHPDTWKPIHRAAGQTADDLAADSWQLAPPSRTKSDDSLSERPRIKGTSLVCMVRSRSLYMAVRFSKSSCAGQQDCDLRVVNSLRLDTLPHVPGIS